MSLLQSSVRSAKRLYQRGREALRPKMRIEPVSDYESYRAAQDAANKLKLDWVYVRECDIEHIANYIGKNISPEAKILCHGTRNGTELKWFAQYLPRATLLGTDIGESASSFPNTIQWDFHEIKEEWRGKWDAVYSNSWDHAFDPERAFKNWMATLSPRGAIFLEHGLSHSSRFVGNGADLFGATFSGLQEFVNRIGAPTFGVIDTIETLPYSGDDRRVVVVGRLPA